jgi:hypothetical protein
VDENASLVPLTPPTSVTFVDTACSSGMIEGVVAFERPSVPEIGITHYSLFWSDGDLISQEIVRVSLLDSVFLKKDLTCHSLFQVPRPMHNTTFGAIVISPSIQLNGTHLAVCAVNHNGYSSSGCAIILIQDVSTPSVLPLFLSIDLPDTNAHGGLIDLRANVSTPIDASVDFYQLFFANSSMVFWNNGPVATAPANDSSSQLISIVSSVPPGATALVAVSMHGQCVSNVTLSPRSSFVDAFTASPLTSPVAIDSSFNDTNCNANRISGSLMFQRSTFELDVSEYVVYWANGTLPQNLMRVAVATFQKSDNASLAMFVFQNTFVLANATHLHVYASNPNGLSDQAAITAISDLNLCPPILSATSSTLVPPLAAPLGISLVGSDRSCVKGIATGVIQMQRPNAFLFENDVERYQCFWGSNSTTVVSNVPIIDAPKFLSNQSQVYLMFENVVVHPNATHILCFYANSKGLSSQSAFATFSDFSYPTAAAENLTLVSAIDTDNRAGYFGGQLTLTQASLNDTVSAYEIWWTDSTGRPLLYLISPIATTSSTQSATRTISISIPLNTLVPSGAVALTALSKNGQCSFPSGPIVTVVDIASIPSTALTIHAPLSPIDQNCVSGIVDVTIVLTDTAAEASHYNIYWASASSTKLTNVSIAIVTAAQLSSQIQLGPSLPIPLAATGIIIFACNALGQANPTGVALTFSDQSFANMSTSSLAVVSGVDSDPIIGEIAVDMSVSGLPAITEYSFAVDMFAYAVVHPTAFKPTQVWDFSAYALSPGNVKLQWNATTSALSFQVSFIVFIV